MPKQKLLSHTDDMQDLLQFYQKELPKLADVQSQRFKQVKERFKHPEYVITVIGAMKSGKSTFINALLGEDLMPNETEACTLTTTDIIYGDHTNEIVKLFHNGKKENLKGNNLAEIFYQEIRGSRLKKGLNYRYQMTHKLHSLKDKQLATDTEFVFVDTPGINEMDGLGVEKSTIINVFHQAIQRTDSLLYIIDYQYYKAEENLEILSLIRDVRPDLLKHLTVIVNKVDKITYKDSSIPEILQEISNALTSWGIVYHTLYPVSARKALGARLIESNSPQLSLHLKEIEALLPSVDLEVGGKLVKARINLEDASETLLEESGILKIEQELIEPYFDGILDKVIGNANDLALSASKEISTQVNEIIIQNNNQIKEREEKIQSKKDEQQDLKKLIAYHREVNIDATQLLKKEVEKWKVKEDLQVDSAHVSSVPSKMNIDGFTCRNKAKEEGEKQLRSWINHEAEQLFQKAVFHYGAGLKFYSSPDNYFFAINQFATRSLKTINNRLRDYSSRYKRVSLVDESLSELPPKLDEKKGKISNMDKYLSKVEVETYSKSYQDSFLLIFTTTRYIDMYSYNILQAVDFTKKELKTDLLGLSNTLFTKYKDLKYASFLNMINKAVSERLNQSVQSVQNEIDQIGRGIQELQTEIHVLKSEISLMIELTQKMEGRTILITKDKIVHVNSSFELEKAIRDSSDGTIIQIEKGFYQLKNANRFNKSIGIFGVKDLTTLELLNGIDVVGSSSLFLKDLVITFKTKKTSIKMESYYANIEDCTFVALKDGTTLLEIVDKLQGEIFRTTFRNATTAMRISSDNKLRVEECYFYQNNTGMDVLEEARPVVRKSQFIEQKYASIMLSANSKGIYKDNHLTDGEGYGIIVKDHATPKFEENEICRNMIAGLLLLNKTKTSLTSNVITESGIGIKMHDFSHADLVGNQISMNSSFGIEIGDVGDITLSHNLLKGNNDSGLSVKQHAKVTAINNEIVGNKGHGIILIGNSTGSILENKVSQNALNGVSALNKASIKAKGNIISENSEAGIFGDHEAQLELNGNHCSENGTGVTVKGQVSLLLVQNTCQENQQYGLSLIGKNTGVIKDNKFLSNADLPMFLSEKQVIKIKANLLKGNKWYTKMKLSYWVTKNRIRQSNKWNAKVRQNE